MTQNELFDTKETIIEDDFDQKDPYESVYPLNRDNVQVAISNRPIFSLLEYLKTGRIELQP